MMSKVVLGLALTSAAMQYTAWALASAIDRERSCEGVPSRLELVLDGGFAVMESQPRGDGWWADGHRKFSIVDDHVLLVRCDNKATGLYQYIPILKRARGDILGLEIGVQIELENRAGGEHVIVKVLGEDPHDGLEKRFTHETPWNSTILIPFRPRAIVLIITCITTVDKVFRVKDIHVNPILASGNKYTHRRDLVGLDCDFLPRKSLSLGQVETIFKGASAIHSKDVTLVTHSTIDRFASVVASLEAWGLQGSSTVVVYDRDNHGKAPITDALQDHFRRRNLRFQDFERMRLMFVPFIGKRYPINALRNLGIESTESDFVLILDADIVPCEGAREAILRREIKPGTLYILPAFEEDGFRKGRSPKRITSKSKLESEVKRGHLFPYKAAHQPKAQGAINYERWYRSNMDYITSYEEQFEPYAVLDRTQAKLPCPCFDTRFQDYGWNKVALFYELDLLGFVFTVLHDVWVIHYAHPKTEISRDFVSNLDVRIENRIHRFEWMHDLVRKYRLCTAQV